MIYPCDGCLVDVICVDECDKLIWYLDALVKAPIPDELICTDNRRARTINATFNFHRGTNLHFNVVKAISNMEEFLG